MIARFAPLLALALALPATAQDASREHGDLVARLERLREETAATRARERVLGEELVDIAGDGARLRQQGEDAAGRVATLEARIAADEEELERLTDGQARVRAALAGKRRELAAVLAALQRIGRQPPPALIGEGGSPTEVVRGAIMLNAVLPGLDGAAQELARQLAEAARMAEAERTRWARLKADLAALEDERARLAALGQELERRRALSSYERERASADLARLAEEADSVTALIARLQGGGSAPPPASGFAARRGTLASPVAGAVVAEYGAAVEAGAISEGRTIAALPGAIVVSPAAGTVLFSRPFRGYGHVLILDAGEGYHVVLAGLEVASVAPGEKVVAGTPVGRMGREGRRSAAASAGVRGSALLGSRPALYVELRKDGVAIDSLGWWVGTAADGGRTGG